jgi:hypothetical protein
MADPLASYAEREIPERTNYFDPAAAQSVISRYASARRRGESAGMLADSAMKIARAQEDQERLVRDRVAWDRADEEYSDRQTAKRIRGDFLRNMQKAIDPASPDYTRQVVEFKAGLPPELQDDDVINSLLTSMNAEADDARRSRDAEVSKKQTLDNQLTMFRERSKYDAALKGITDEDVKAATMPDGSIDMLSLGMKAGARKRSLASEEWDRKNKAVQEGRLKFADRLDMGKSARALHDELKLRIADPAAFPNRADMVLAQYRKEKGQPNASKDMLMGEWASRLAEAEAWDKSKFEREVLASQEYDDMEDYVKLGGEGLTPNQKKSREIAWKLGHKEDVFVETEAPAAPAGAKPLTTEAAARFKELAKGDRAMAEKLARDEGYDF